MRCAPTDHEMETHSSTNISDFARARRAAKTAVASQSWPSAAPGRRRPRANARPGGADRVHVELGADVGGGRAWRKRHQALQSSTLDLTNSAEVTAAMVEARRLERAGSFRRRSMV
jgi:hypothetical protein